VYRFPVVGRTRADAHGDTTMTRRSILPKTALAVCLLSACAGPSLAGCTTTDAKDDGRPRAPAEWDRKVVRPSDEGAEAARARCQFARGALAGETVGQSQRIGDDIPIKKVIVVMQENRSFDHYFHRFPAWAGRNDIDVAPSESTNPSVAGGTDVAARMAHAEHYCFLDTNHEWSGTHRQINGGKMDGFFETNEGWSELLPGMSSAFHSGARALWYHDERDIPFYFQLWNTFAIADRYFASVPGPTWPNRMYLYAGTSFGKSDNHFPDVTALTFPEHDVTIFDMLEKRRVTWGYFTDGFPAIGIVYAAQITSRWGEDDEHRRVFKAPEFFARLEAGTLPEVTFFDARIGNEGPLSDDEHPPANVQLGQKLVSDIVHGLFRSPDWKHTALFLTYDEHGGLYDHVPPPSACVPDDAPFTSDEGETPEAGERPFSKLGVRVPFALVSPYAKRGYVSHTVYDHASVARFIETKFRLPALTARDANADPMLDLFDFDAPPFMTPPELTKATVNQAEVDWCVQNFTRRR
jgi:phospholipase C